MGQTPLCSFPVVSPFRSFYMQLVTPNVAAIAVSTVMRMMGILLEVNELLLYGHGMPCPLALVATGPRCSRPSGP